jgi:hypothetical protein
MKNDDRIRGYLAADIRIEEMLHDAKQKLEPYAKREGRKLEWWKGYYEGLLIAHCMMVLGQFPNQPNNKQQIDELLTPETPQNEQ